MLQSLLHEYWVTLQATGRTTVSSLLRAAISRTASPSLPLFRRLLAAFPNAEVRSLGRLL
jgi:hypothetical protein